RHSDFSCSVYHPFKHFAIATLNSSKTFVGGTVLSVYSNALFDSGAFYDVRPVVSASFTETKTGFVDSTTSDPNFSRGIRNTIEYLAVVPPNLPISSVCARRDEGPLVAA